MGHPLALTARQLGDLTMMTHAPRGLAYLLAAWTTLALAFAFSGLLPLLPEIAVPTMIFGTTAVVGSLVWRRPNLRAAVAHLDLRWLVAIHVVRAPVGAWFLALGAAGTLHPTFVRVAGYGDIVAGGAALLALIALTTAPPSAARLITLAFNAVAALDILVVLVTAQRILLFGPGMEAMQGFFDAPGPLIPSWLVPLVLLTHAAIFWRLAPRSSAPSAGTLTAPHSSGGAGGSSPT